MEIVSNIEETTATIALTGKLTVQTSPDLSATIDALPEDVCNINIDFTGIDYIASAGLRVLVAASKLANKRGGALTLLNPNEDVMDIFDMTGLSQVLTIEQA